MDRLGALGDGGKWVCGIDAVAAQRAPCVVYSFGINRDSSFEADLLQRAPNCEVWGYDFSVTMFGPEIHDNHVLSPKTHFAPYRLGAINNPHLSPPEFTVSGLMERNGHAFVDILKIDIEGGEFDALAAFLRPFLDTDAPPLPVGQLELEIHAWNSLGDFAPFYSWWQLMEKAGLRPFWTEPNIVHVSHLRNRPDVVEVGCRVLASSQKGVDGVLRTSILCLMSEDDMYLSPQTIRLEPTHWFTSMVLAACIYRSNSCNVTQYYLKAPVLCELVVESRLTNLELVNYLSTYQTNRLHIHTDYYTTRLKGCKTLIVSYL
jgi:hypothetical protein